MVDPGSCAADTLELWSFLPDFVQVADEAGGYQFLSWLDGTGQQQQIIDNLCRDQNGFVGWSILMDVSRCPAYALPWLAQFVGVRFSSAQLTNVDSMRSAIVAKGNFGRGTPQSIANSLIPYLGPNSYVNIIERYPDAYSFTVQVRGALGSLTYAELAKADPTYPDVAAEYPFYDDFPEQDQAVVTAAVQSSTPAGLVLTVAYD